MRKISTLCCPACGGGINVWFDCADCGALPLMKIYQHNGETIVTLVDTADAAGNLDKEVEDED